MAYSDVLPPLAGVNFTDMPDMSVTSVKYLRFTIALLPELSEGANDVSTLRPFISISISVVPRLSEPALRPSM